MRSFYRVTIEKASIWPNKDTSEKTIDKWSFRIPIPQLTGDAYSKDLNSMLLKNKSKKTL